MPTRFVAVHLRDGAQPMTFSEAMESAGRAYLMRVLSESNGDMTKAAKLAGLHRTTIYKLLPKYGVKVEHRAYVRQVDTEVSNTKPAPIGFNERKWLK